MPVQGWRERHGTCCFGTFRPAATEGWLVAGCANPAVGDRYDEEFCANTCPAYQARAGRAPKGRIPDVETSRRVEIRGSKLESR